MDETSKSRVGRSLVPTNYRGCTSYSTIAKPLEMASQSRHRHPKRHLGETHRVELECILIPTLSWVYSYSRIANCFIHIFVITFESIFFNCPHQYFVLQGFTTRILVIHLFTTTYINLIIFLYNCCYLLTTTK